MSSSQGKKSGIPSTSSIMTSFHRQQQHNNNNTMANPLVTNTTHATDNQLNRNTGISVRGIVEQKPRIAFRDPNTINIDEAPSGLFSQNLSTVKEIGQRTEMPNINNILAQPSHLAAPTTPFLPNTAMLADIGAFPEAYRYLLSTSASSFGELISREAFVADAINTLRRVGIEESFTQKVQAAFDAGSRSSGNDDDCDNAQSHVEVNVVFGSTIHSNDKSHLFQSGDQKRADTEDDNARSPASRRRASPALADPRQTLTGINRQNSTTLKQLTRHNVPPKSSYYFTLLEHLENMTLGRALFEPTDILLGPTVDRLNRFVISKDGSITTHGLTPKTGYDSFGLWQQYLQAVAVMELSKEMAAEGPAMFEAILLLIGVGCVNLLGNNDIKLETNYLAARDEEVTFGTSSSSTPSRKGRHSSATPSRTGTSAHVSPLIERNRKCAIDNFAANNLANIPLYIANGTLPAVLASHIKLADHHTLSVGTELATDASSTNTSGSISSLGVSKRVALQHIAKTLQETISACASAKVLQTSAPTQLWMSSFFGVNFLRAGMKVNLHSSWNTAMATDGFQNLRRNQTNLPNDNSGTNVVHSTRNPSKRGNQSQTQLLETLENALQAEREVLKVAHQRNLIFLRSCTLSHLISCGTDIFIPEGIEDDTEFLKARMAMCLQPDPRSLSRKIFANWGVDRSPDGYKDWHYPAHYVGPHFRYNQRDAGGLGDDNIDRYVPAATSILACREMSQLRMINDQPAMRMAVPAPTHDELSTSGHLTTKNIKADGYLSPIDVIKGPTEPRRSVVASVVTMANYLYPVAMEELIPSRCEGWAKDHMRQERRGCVPDLTDPYIGLGDDEGPTSASINCPPAPFSLCRRELPAIMGDTELISVHQPDLRPHMRVVLADWLTEVCAKYKFEDETFLLSMSIVDAFLALPRNPVGRNQLQLVGSASLMIAAKFEEIYPPSSADFVHITDHAFSLEDLLEMEQMILLKLSFKLSYPSVLMFAQCILSSASAAALRVDTHVAANNNQRESRIMKSKLDSGPISRALFMHFLSKKNQKVRTEAYEERTTPTRAGLDDIDFQVARTLFFQDDDLSIQKCDENLTQADAENPTQEPASNQKEEILGFTSPQASQQAEQRIWPPLDVFGLDTLTLKDLKAVSEDVTSPLSKPVLLDTDINLFDNSEIYGCAVGGEQLDSIFDSLSIAKEELIYPLELRTRAMLLSPKCLTSVTAYEAQRTADVYQWNHPYRAAGAARRSEMNNNYDDKLVIQKLLGEQQEYNIPPHVTAVSGPLRLSVSEVSRRALNGLAHKILKMRALRRQTLVADITPQLLVNIAGDSGGVQEFVDVENAMSPSTTLASPSRSSGAFGSPSMFRTSVSLPRRRKQKKATFATAMPISSLISNPVRGGGCASNDSTPSKRKLARKSSALGTKVVTMKRTSPNRNTSANNNQSSVETSFDTSSAVSSTGNSASKYNDGNENRKNHLQKTTSYCALSSTKVEDAIDCLSTLAHVPASVALRLVAQRKEVGALPLSERSCGLALLMKRYYTQGQWLQPNPHLQRRLRISQDTVEVLKQRAIDIEATPQHQPHFDYVLTSQLSSGSHLEHSMVIYLCYLVTVRTCYGELALPSTTAAAIISIARLWAGEVLFDVNSEAENKLAQEVQRIEWTIQALEEEIMSSRAENLSSDHAESPHPMSVQKSLTSLKNRLIEAEESAKEAVDFQMAILFPTAAVRDAAAHIVTLLLNERNATHELLASAHRAFEAIHESECVWINEAYRVGGVANGLRSAAESVRTCFASAGLDATGPSFATPFNHQNSATTRFTSPEADAVMHEVTRAITETQNLLAEEEQVRRAQKGGIGGGYTAPKTGIFMKFISRKFDSVSLLPVASIVEKLAKRAH